MKKLTSFIVVLCILCLLVACGGKTPESQERQNNHGVSADENRIPEQYAKNPDIMYSENPYILPFTCFAANGYYNLTETAGGSIGGGQYYHYEIISDPGRLEEICQLVEKKAEISDPEASAPVFRDRAGKPYDFPHTISDRLPINETLLEEYDLLMIDLMLLDTGNVYLRPDRLEVKDGTVSLELQQGSTAITTGDNAGCVLFIAIPKGCETAQIEKVYVNSWSDHSAGPGL